MGSSLVQAAFMPCDFHVLCVSPVHSSGKRCMQTPLRRSFIPFGGLKPTLVFIWSSQRGAATRLLIPSCTGTALFWPGENLATRPSPLPADVSQPRRGSWGLQQSRSRGKTPGAACTAWSAAAGHCLCAQMATACPELRAARGAVPRLPSGCSACSEVSAKSSQS